MPASASDSMSQAPFVARPAPVASAVVSGVPVRRSIRDFRAGTASAKVRCRGGRSNEVVRTQPAEPRRRGRGRRDRRAVRRARDAAPADPVAPRHETAAAVRQRRMARGGARGARGGVDRADRGVDAWAAGSGRNALGIEPWAWRRAVELRSGHRHDARDARRRLAPQHPAATAAGRRRAAGLRRRQLPDPECRFTADPSDRGPLGAGHRRAVPAVHRGSGGAAAGARAGRVARQPRGRPPARGAGHVRPAPARGARPVAAADRRDGDRRP